VDERDRAAIVHALAADPGLNPVFRHGAVSIYEFRARVRP
jgi:hypothetical protein